MHDTHAAVVAEDDVQSSLTLSPASWSWYSGQRTEPFTFAPKKGIKKPKKKRSQEYGTANERVLAVMSKLALHTGYACPSVKTIMKEANCSRSTAKRARHYLKRTGALIAAGHSGPEYRGTAVFIVGSRMQATPQMNPNVDVYRKKGIRKNRNSLLKTSADTLIEDKEADAHKEDEVGIEQEQSKSQNQDQNQKPLPPVPHAPLSTAKPWPAGTFCRSGTWEHAGPLLRQMIEQVLFGRDSMLVRRLNEERAKAGRAVPTSAKVRAVEGRQLRCLAKRFGYEKVLNEIIPAVVSHWPSLLCLWVYEKSKVKIDPEDDNKPIRKAPLPEEPSIGFVLTHWKIVKKFCEWLRWIEQTPDHELAPDCKEFLWTQLSEYEFKTGSLPTTIPAPYRKGKHWNSPVWEGHPPGTISKIKYGGCAVANGTWNAKTEAKALVKLINKGASKDHACCVLSHIKAHWGAFTEKVKVVNKNLLYIDKHPYLVIDYWGVAQAFYADRAKYEALGYWEYVKKIYAAQ